MTIRASLMRGMSRITITAMLLGLFACAQTSPAPAPESMGIDGDMMAAGDQESFEMDALDRASSDEPFASPDAELAMEGTGEIAKGAGDALSFTGPRLLSFSVKAQPLTPLPHEQLSSI